MNLTKRARLAETCSRFSRAAGLLPLLVVSWLAAGGCENIALVGRDSLKLEPAEVVVEVERVDAVARQIRLRPSPERVTVVSYNDHTQVVYRGHELPVTDLKAGDIVAMHVKEAPPGHFYSDFLSLRERSGERSSVR